MIRIRLLVGSGIGIFGRFAKQLLPDCKRYIHLEEISYHLVSISKPKALSIWCALDISFSSTKTAILDSSSDSSHAKLRWPAAYPLSLLRWSTKTLSAHFLWLFTSTATYKEFAGDQKLHLTSAHFSRLIYTFYKKSTLQDRDLKSSISPLVHIVLATTYGTYVFWFLLIHIDQIKSWSTFLLSCNFPSIFGRFRSLSTILSKVFSHIPPCPVLLLLHDLFSLPLSPLPFLFIISFLLKPASAYYIFFFILVLYISYKRVHEFTFGVKEWYEESRV